MRAKMLGGLLASLIMTSCGSGGSSSSAGGSVSPATYTIGGTITGLVGAGLTLQSGNETLSVAKGATSFTFATRVSSGAPYTVSVATQPGVPTQTCTIQNDSGTLGSNISNIAVNCVTNAQTYIYVLNTDFGTRYSSQITTYAFNSQTGAIVSVANADQNDNNTARGNTAVPSCSNVLSLVQPTRLMTARGTPNAGVFCNSEAGMIDLSTTDLTPGLYVSGPQGSQQAVDIYTHPGDKISFYIGTNANSTPGELQPIDTSILGGQRTGTAATAGINPKSALVDPLGKYLIIANNGDGIAGEAALRTFATTSPEKPALATVYALPTAPAALAYAASGPFVFASSPSETIGYAFTADTEGKLTPIGTGTFAAITGVQLYATTGDFLFAAAPASGLVQSYRIGATGRPTPVGSPVQAGTLPVKMTIDPTGQFLLVLTQGTSGYDGRTPNKPVDAATQSTIVVYAIGSTGGLTPVPGSPFPALGGATAFVVTKNAAPK